MNRSREPKDVLEFAAALGIGVYDWQANILLALEQAATLTRRKFAVRAPNGCGKTQRITALSAIRWLQRFPRGKVIITSFDSRQVSDQLWPAIQAQLTKFPRWGVSNAEKVIATPTGGRLRAFTTDDPGRAEGFHADADCPLLIIVDEAKSVPPDIIQAIDRCSYNVLVYISSPGLMQGPFYQAFTSDRGSFVTFAVGLSDCPHISKEKIDDISSSYGEDDPFTRSTLFGEFMQTDDSVQHVFELSDIEINRSASIGLTPGLETTAIDFAGGRDRNVVLKRTGNHVQVGNIKAWREKNTNAAVGRILGFLNAMKCKASHTWADADGIGLTLVNDLNAAGWKVNRFYGNSASPHPRYKNLISYAWHETARRVKKFEIAVPDNQELIADLSSRRLKRDNQGKLWLEDKEEMRERGVNSPDLGDAFCMAFSLLPATSHSWISKSTSAESNSKFGQWEEGEGDKASPEDNGPTWPGGFPGRDDPGELGGFGGVHSMF
jgi:phage terminase large subunit